MKLISSKKIKSLRVENLKKDDFFSTGTSCKKYYKTLSINNDLGKNHDYIILKAWLVDVHGIPFPGRPKKFHNRKFVKNFVPNRERLKCH